MSEGQDLSRNPQAKEFFQRMAEDLARDHAGLNVNRTVKILKRTARDVHGQRLTEWPKLPSPPHGKYKLKLFPNVWFSPGLGSALKHMEPKDALRLFETEDLGTLARREYAIDYFLSREVPLYNLDELAGLTNKFIKYQELNRSYIVDRGYPHEVFTPTHVFSWSLTSIYSFVGRWDLAVEEDVYEAISREELMRRYFGEETQWRELMDIQDIARVDSERGKLFDLRIRVLKEALSSLETQDASDLLDRCLVILAEVLSKEEVEFYLRKDGSFSKFMLKDSKAPLELGGYLYAMLVFIGHCEQEINIGMMAKTRDALGSFVEGRRGRRFLQPGIYYSAIGKPERKSVDSACDSFQKLEARARKFWPQYEKRLNEVFQQRFRVRVEFSTLVSGEFARPIEKYYQAVVEAKALEAEATGRFIPGGEFDESIRTALSKQQIEDKEKYGYKCEDRLEITGRRTPYRGSIVKINGIYITIGDALLVILLRLIVQLKKDKKGWVSLETLWNEELFSDANNTTKLSEIRSKLKGSLLDKDEGAGDRFIELDTTTKKSYRISTHPDLVICKREDLMIRVQQDVSQADKEKILGGHPSINEYTKAKSGRVDQKKSNLYWNWKIEEIAKDLPD